MDEEWRYATVNAQLKALLDAAAADLNPAANILRAQLYAERYTLNEEQHQRVMEARRGFMQVLQMIIERIR